MVSCTKPLADKKRAELYLDDLAVFDHLAKQLLVFCLILFLFQFCCMLGNVGENQVSR